MMKDSNMSAENKENKTNAMWFCQCLLPLGYYEGTVDLDD
jgi:hypothetical protein